MVAEDDQTLTLQMFTVEALSPDIDPGAELALRIRASCRPRHDLRGLALEIRDEDDETVAAGRLAEFDGDVSEIEKLVVPAPAEPGSYTWRAVFLTAEGDGPETAFAFTVKGHRTQPLVWDVPPCVEAGKPFRVKIGARSSAGLVLAGTEVLIHDETGAELARVELPAETWPGTAALYYAEAALTAPDREGKYQWEARVLALDTDPPHGEGRAAFTVRTVPEPECLVRVAVADQKSQQPIAGARITMHPYRGVADAGGIAEIRVPKGSYRIFAKAPRYHAARTDVEVQADVTTRLELVLDAVDEHAWWVGT